MRLIIVSNRLPVTVVDTGTGFHFHESVGGLVTSLSSFLEQLPHAPSGITEYLWVGWPGISVAPERQGDCRSKGRRSRQCRGEGRGGAYGGQERHHRGCACHQGHTPGRGLMAGRPAVEDVLPLSPMQEGMVFHALYDAQGHDVYTGQMTLRLEGPVDGLFMSVAVAKLLARHANLRAAFRTQRSGRPVQVIRRAVRTPWQVTDLSALTPPEVKTLLAGLQAG